MPLYAYECEGDGCPVCVTQLRKADDRDEERPCPDCGDQRLVRKLPLGIKVVFTSGGTGAMANPRKSPLDK